MKNDIMKLADAFAEAFEAAECNDAKETIKARAALEAEIDELRTALQEREAEIEALKDKAATVKYWFNAYGEVEAKLAAQRKVLDQALKYIRKTAVFIPHEYDHEGLEATTAIQGALA